MDTMQGPMSGSSWK